MKLMKAIKKLYSPRKLDEKGFTLIELLVVVGILGVLAGVVTLGVGQFIGKGKTEAQSTELHNMQTAVVAYMANNSGATPATTAALVTAGYLISTPHGTYTWDANGVVTQTAYP